MYFVRAVVMMLYLISCLICLYYLTRILSGTFRNTPHQLHSDWSDAFMGVQSNHPSEDNISQAFSLIHIQLDWGWNDPGEV